MLAIKAFRLLASRLVIEEGDSKFTTQGMLFVGGEGAIYYPRNVVCWGRGGLKWLCVQFAQVWLVM